MTVIPGIVLAGGESRRMGRDKALVPLGGGITDFCDVLVDEAVGARACTALADALADLARTEQALARLAAAHRDTPMPGRTLTQHAVPTTFGLKAAGWRSLVLDARDRVRAVRDRLPAQLGGAAGTLAAFSAFAPGTEPTDTLAT